VTSGANHLWRSATDREDNIARELARQIGAVHLRIDSIEQAIRDCSPDAAGLDEAGYRVAYPVAEDNLQIES
jgi:predicted kinase